MQTANHKVNWNGNSTPILVIAGPTASGKSDLALALAERIGGEIVNADSMQVYRELSILTGRPSFDEESRVPHHLYGTQSVANGGSAGMWLKAALSAIEKIRLHGQLPIVCGGTGLYIKVLCEGIAPVPDISHEMVSRARKLYEEEGGIAFRARLRRIDPHSADRLPHADRQRLIRAYVVRQSTGYTVDDWKDAQTEILPNERPRFVINLMPPRHALYKRIDRRLLAMVQAGALEEVAGLDPGLDSNLPALKAMGVNEFRRHLNGQCSLDEAIKNIQMATRKFAKRQITWFRNQLVADFQIDGFGDQSENVIVQEIVPKLTKINAI